MNWYGRPPSRTYCHRTRRLITTRVSSVRGIFYVFELAFEMLIDISLRDNSPTFECYLDDLFGVDQDCDRSRLEADVPLALHLVGRPATDEESFPRDDLLSDSKFIAEANASEQKIILGWVINTRAFTVSLPVDKHRVCTNDLRRIRNQPGRRARSKDLEAMIGRLNHAAFVVPNSRPSWGDCTGQVNMLKPSTDR